MEDPWLAQSSLSPTQSWPCEFPPQPAVSDPAVGSPSFFQAPPAVPPYLLPDISVRTVTQSPTNDDQTQYAGQFVLEWNKLPSNDEPQLCSFISDSSI